MVAALAGQNRLFPAQEVVRRQFFTTTGLYFIGIFASLGSALFKKIPKLELPWSHLPVGSLHLVCWGILESLSINIEHMDYDAGNLILWHQK